MTIPMVKMSAKDKESFQEFPQASFTIPLPVKMEEVSAMAQSLLEGQQDVGESAEGDPYAKAVRYLEEHRIIEILQNLTTRIAFERPEKPVQFLMEEIAKIQKGEPLKEPSRSKV